MNTTPEPVATPTRLPPRWFIRIAWVVHRAVYRFGGRGLRKPTADLFGMLRVRTKGRRSGAERLAILAYYEDGPDLIGIAMNGWGALEPAWWLNLKAHPDASVDLVDGKRNVHAREAQGQERNRLWARWAHYDKNLDRSALHRPGETAVVIFEPAPPRINANP